MTTALAALTTCALGAAILFGQASPATGGPTPGASIGLEMPAAGIDGAEGLSARIAVRLGGARVVTRDSALGGFVNPHQDEGVDNIVDVREAPAIVAGFAANPRISAAIGGLRRRVGDVDAVAAKAHRLPMIVLSRWSRNGSNGTAYCVCASPAHLVAFARTEARKRFGPRLLLVLVGDAAEIEPDWRGRLGPPQIAKVSAQAASVSATRERARGADAVLVLADERPPTLWQAGAFRRSFDLDYVRNLGHRDFEAIPATAPGGAVATIETRFSPSAARTAFERSYHSAAGYLPGKSATRAFAAAQIVTQAGKTRAEVRRALGSRRFTTIVGGVAFDADGFWTTIPLAMVAFGRNAASDRGGRREAAASRVRRKA
jgi:hypothetical protein